MTPIEAALARAITDLAGHRIALVGALAVGVRAEPRFTRDADLAVAVRDDEDAEQLVLSLQRSGWRVHALVEHDARERLATVRLGAPIPEAPRVVVDLLFASSGVEAEITALAEAVEVFPGLVVPVAVRGHLIAMKVLSRDDVRRPQDLVDLRSLMAAATAEDLEIARQALADMARRGYDRGRPLLDDLGVLLASRTRT